MRVGSRMTGVPEPHLLWGQWQSSPVLTLALLHSSQAPKAGIVDRGPGWQIRLHGNTLPIPAFERLKQRSIKFKDILVLSKYQARLSYMKLYLKQGQQ